MYLDELFDLFKENMQSERNVAPSTITSYQNDYNCSHDFLCFKRYSLDIKLISTSVLRDWISYMMFHKKYHSNTIRRKIHSMSSFFKYLHENKIILDNPMQVIHAPKKQTAIPKYLNEKELSRLLIAPEKYARYESHIKRDKALLAVFIYTGARRSEVLNLNWDDFDFHKKEIIIRKGKGNKQRIVPMLPPLEQTLWEYLIQRLPLHNKVFLLSDNNTRMSQSNIHQLIRRYIDLSGFKNMGYSIHSLRHSYATLLYQNGVDILSISQLLGHKDLNTTQIYTHTTSAHLRKQAEKFRL